jgi:preprotein translocase subunit SecE
MVLANFAKNVRPVKRTWQTLRKTVRPTDKKLIITTIVVFIEEKLKGNTAN